MLIYATHLLAACCGAFVAFLWFLFSEHREVQEAQRIADEITVEAMMDGVERWKKRHCCSGISPEQMAEREEFCKQYKNRTGFRKHE